MSYRGQRRLLFASVSPPFAAITPVHVKVVVDRKKTSIDMRTRGLCVGSLGKLEMARESISVPLRRQSAPSPCLGRVPSNMRIENCGIILMSITKPIHLRQSSPEMHTRLFAPSSHPSKRETGSLLSLWPTDLQVPLPGVERTMLQTYSQRAISNGKVCHSGHS